MRALVLTLLAAFALSACGQSPLLNHINESDLQPKVQGPQPAGETVACAISFAKTKLCATITWVEGPKPYRLNTFNLQLTDAETGKGIEPQTEVQATLWMPAMGHGSDEEPVVGRADGWDASQNPGAYVVTNVLFIMRGQWDLIIRLVKDGAVVDEVKVPVKL